MDKLSVIFQNLRHLFPWFAGHRIWKLRHLFPWFAGHRVWKLCVGEYTQGASRAQ